MTQKLHPESRCPRCGGRTGHASDINPASTAQVVDQPLREGDLAVCIRCGEILRLTIDLRQRRLDPGEFEALPARVQNELVHTQLLARAFRATFSRN
jgi:DNA-directed RNA polymerase subunit RPC12/RpoP